MTPVNRFVNAITLSARAQPIVRLFAVAAIGWLSSTSGVACAQTDSTPAPTYRISDSDAGNRVIPGQPKMAHPIPSSGVQSGIAGPIPGYHESAGRYHTAPVRRSGVQNPSDPPRDPWELARRLGIAGNASYPIPHAVRHEDWARQSAADAIRKSESCIHCHTDVGNMHPPNTINIGCVDCHGGNAQAYTIEHSHVIPRFPPAWKGAANPERSYTLLKHESPEFVRFMNPGDLRVAHIACGQCHAQEVLQMRKSMMTHGGMLWGAALYNNGASPSKWTRYGESYSMIGNPQRLQTVPAPTADEIRNKGILPFLDPLPPYQISQPGNVLRIFERGGRFLPEIGIPEPLEEPGRPRERLSLRGLGTDNRTDPVFIGLQKNPIARSDLKLFRHQRPSRRLSQQWLQCLSRPLCQ